MRLSDANIFQQANDKDIRLLRCHEYKVIKIKDLLLINNTLTNIGITVPL